MITPSGMRGSDPAAGIQKTHTILDRIVARKIEEVAALKIDLRSAITPPPLRALRLKRNTVALIAEIKHASPSKGVLIDPFEPATLARIYRDGGAAAISVLTDVDYFGGSLDDLRTVRAVVPLPVLRKDFIIDERQIYQSRMVGADAILLIAAILDDAKLRDLHTLAVTLGMAVLVEVHTELEMARVLKLNVPLIGVNNRDLHTFHVDLGVTLRLARLVPPEVTLVAESGIFTPEHVAQVGAVGAHAVLVGEALVKAPDIPAQVRALAGVPRV